MKRKIVQHGSSSLTITLPVKWIQKYNLSKGDEVDVEEQGPSLTVRTEAELAPSKKEIRTSEQGVFTKNNLSHLYQLGYDEIEITFDDEQSIDDIKERVQECIGFEIIDQSESKAYIKSIATTLESEFDTLLRKSFLITNEMARNLIDAIEKEEYDRVKEIRAMESLNNRFTDVCIRTLNKKGYGNQKRNMQMYEIIKMIERICDNLKYICDVLIEHKRVGSNNIQNIKECIDYYTLFYDIFYKFDATKKKKMYTERKKLTAQLSEQLAESSGADSLILHHLLTMIQICYEALGAHSALVL